MAANLDVVSTYDKWSTDSEVRRAMALDVLRQHVVAAFDSWVVVARNMLFEGVFAKSPTANEQRVIDWINGMSYEERGAALCFAREMVQGGLFSMMCHIDGCAGSVLAQPFRERIHLKLTIYHNKESNEVPTAVEQIPVNEEEGTELHEIWFDWLERFSRKLNWPEAFFSDPSQNR